MWSHGWRWRGETWTASSTAVMRWERGRRRCPAGGGRGRSGGSVCAGSRWILVVSTHRMLAWQVKLQYGPWTAEQVARLRSVPDHSPRKNRRSTGRKPKNKAHIRRTFSSSKSPEKRLGVACGSRLSEMMRCRRCSGSVLICAAGRGRLVPFEGEGGSYGGGGSYDVMPGSCSLAGL